MLRSTTRLTTKNIYKETITRLMQFVPVDLLSRVSSPFAVHPQIVAVEADPCFFSFLFCSVISVSYIKDSRKPENHKKGRLHVLAL